MHYIFSFFRGPICSKKGQIPTKVMDLKEAHSFITSDTAKRDTIALRTITNTKDHSSYKKEHFAFTTFSGTFEGVRKTDNLIEPSGLLCLDFDHIDNVHDFFDKVRMDHSFTAELIFISPSGDGVKVVVPCDPSLSFGVNFANYTSYFYQSYGLTADPSCKDISRACFLPYDPDCYLNITGVHKYLTTQKRDVKYPETDGVEVDINRVIDVVKVIEEKQIDITGDYNTWCQLGFAMAFLGERGRDFFHRISRFYPYYNVSDTDKQFDKCLKNYRVDNGITLGTFYWLVQKNGIDITTEKKGCASCVSCVSCVSAEAGSKKNDEGTLPTISNKIIAKLPEIIKKGISCAITEHEADLILLTMLTTLSVLIPNIHFFYGGDFFYPTIITIVEGAASAGKGRLNLAYALTGFYQKNWDDDFLREKEAYKFAKKEKKSNLAEPRQKLIVLPSDCTDPALKTQLSDNGGIGLIVETEAEAITNCFTTDYGKYSATLRKTWNHETLALLRKTDREKVIVPLPRLGALIGGTKNQIKSLMGDVSTGLFSRCAFYHLPLDSVWKNPFEQTLSVHNQMIEIAKIFEKEYYAVFRSWKDIEFTFTQQQKDTFNQTFAAKHLEAFTDPDENLNIVPVVRRFGVLCCRFSLILSALKWIEHGNKNANKIICDDESFSAALNLCDTLLEHARYEQTILGVTKPNIKSKVMDFYNFLPDVFTRVDYKKTAEEHGFNVRSVDRYITYLRDNEYIEHFDYNQYRKIKL